MHRRTVLLLALLLGLSAAAWADADNPRVRLVTNKGDIVLQLDRAKAPRTVENFLQYVQDGFYNGTLFHRVIDGFMIQGGGFSADFVQKPTRAPIMNEADNGLRNTVGTIAMARTSDPHSATAQFFINVSNNEFLDFREKTPRAWGYAVFGRVVSGMEVVKAIKETRTGAGGMFPKDVPQEPIIIQQAVIVSDGQSKQP
jgi:peptidyl-prolyl cis-trans isomerase B (cyclophilin B)